MRAIFLRQARQQLTRRRTWDARIAVAGGAAYVGLGLFAAGRPEQWERVVLRAVNHGVGRIPLSRVMQQLGTPWMLPGLGAVGFVTRRPHLAVAGALALPLEKASEVGIKKVAARRRPAQEQPEARLRDDAPAEGPSYPSGHAAIAYTAFTLLAPYTPTGVGAGLGVLGALATARRVQQAAHYPLDAIGGVLLGVSLASGLHYVVGLPERPLPR